MCSRFLEAGVVICAALLVGACEREQREFDPGREGARLEQSVAGPDRIAHYERNARALASGKRLWTWYNCSGCHGAGGGGASGPALMDNKWLHGWDAASIYTSIAEGRANGMPAYRGRIAEDELWQLTAYVRSMSGLAPQDGAPNRDDALLTRKPESFSDKQKPEEQR